MTKKRRRTDFWWSRLFTSDDFPQELRAIILAMKFFFPRKPILPKFNVRGSLQQQTFATQASNLTLFKALRGRLNNL